MLWVSERYRNGPFAEQRKKISLYRFLTVVELKIKIIDLKFLCIYIFIDVCFEFSIQLAFNSVLKLKYKIEKVELIDLVSEALIYI